MRWTVHGRRSIYESPWISLDLVDIELPDGQRFEQHVARMARPVAGAAIVDAGQVLLIWRHRHITDTWGWEIPTGRVEADEDPAHAAAREVEEETGWRPIPPLQQIVASQPSNGSIDTVHYLYRGEGARQLGPPIDRTEAQHIQWIPLSDITDRIDAGEIVSGPTLIALLYLLARAE